jgi:HEPN domain-containing protein
LKALWFYFDEDPWGHSIYRLIEELPQKAKYKELDQLKELALLLDRLYIPTRYPNGLPGLTPKEAYNKHDVDESIKAATSIIETIERIVQ